MTHDKLSFPIAELLGLTPAAIYVEVNGEKFQLCGGTHGTVETIYRVNPGYGVGNPGFTLFNTPEPQRKMQLGNYLANRPGVKRAQAEAIVDNAAVRVLTH
jgi:hypothetical protein